MRRPLCPGHSLDSEAAPVSGCRQMDYGSTVRRGRLFALLLLELSLAVALACIATRVGAAFSGLGNLPDDPSHPLPTPAALDRTVPLQRAAFWATFATVSIGLGLLHLFWSAVRRLSKSSNTSGRGRFPWIAAIAWCGFSATCAECALLMSLQRGAAVAPLLSFSCLVSTALAFAALLTAWRSTFGWRRYTLAYSAGVLLIACVRVGLDRQLSLTFALSLAVVTLLIVNRGDARGEESTRSVRDS